MDFWPLDPAANYRSDCFGIADQTDFGAPDRRHGCRLHHHLRMEFPHRVDGGRFFKVATDRDHEWVFMVCALFGSLIALLGASHGTLGFSKWLGRLCRGPKSTLLVTWIMGILIFVDDYLNIMTLSTCMKKLTDTHKVPVRRSPM